MRKTDNFAVLMIDLQVDFCSPDGFAAKLNRNLEPISLMLTKLKEFYRETKKSGAYFYNFRPKEPDTGLLKVLWRKRITTLVLAGVRTELSVDATAKRAISEGFEVVLASDLVATYKEKMSFQKQFLELFNRYYGNVKKSQAILDDFEDRYL